MSFLVVVPSIWQPYTDACVRTLHCDPDDLLVVDNTVQNRGVAASWNMGARKVLAQHRDWLVICSAAMRFAGRGIHSFTDQLAAHKDADAVEAACDLGWHLIAIPFRTLDKVGLFDENFFPAYMEDLDYGYRIRVACGIDYVPGVESWPKVPVAAHLESAAHGIQLAGVRGDGAQQAAYFAAKWGGPSGQEKFVRPFDMPDPTWIGWWPQLGSDGALPRPEYARSDR